MWWESAVGLSRDSLGKGAAARFKEEPMRTSGNTIGGAYKTESQILMCLPKSKLKGVLIEGKIVILVGSLVWVRISEITVSATTLAVLQEGPGTRAGG